MKKLILILLGAGLVSLSALIFWKQELQYLLPTPKPKNYISVPVSTKIKLDAAKLPVAAVSTEQAVLYHFYNPACPCSRFVTDHFVELSNNFGNKVKFVVVLPHAEDSARVSKDFRQKNSLINVVVDSDKQLAKMCGVYSTPQAALLTANGKLYYRGNYNRSRYCTDKSTRYVQKALEALVSEQAPPQFTGFATESYGCNLNRTNDWFYLLSI